MTQFCPKCGRIADYDPFSDRYYCTSLKCDYRSNKTEDIVHEILMGNNDEHVCLKDIYKEKLNKYK